MLKMLCISLNCEPQHHIYIPSILLDFLANKGSICTFFIFITENIIRIT